MASSTSINNLALTAPVTQGTPLTGAGKMAAAAASLKRGAGSDEIRRELQYNDEEHPLSDKVLASRGYHTLHTLQHLFHVPDRWRLLRPLGQGAYGLVISVQDSISGEPVAVKCITRVFDKPILARRALREITLLRHFGEHENLTGLIDLDNVWDGYNEIYLYMEPMEADLHQIVRSGQPLSNLHIQFFLYQLLRGMKYIHSANVIHRDLKPGNLLVNSDCELKICDFGLARGFVPIQGEAGQNDELKLTEYVATRWYRAPEIMLSNRRYTTAIDVWSIGCILGELLGGKPMFKGKDYVDQLNLILGVLGTPDDATLDRIASEKAANYVRSLPKKERVPFEDVLPDAEPDAVDLLGKLLAFDPAERLDVTTALQHPYVAAYHDPADEPVCEFPFEKWQQVESLQTIEELREAITREIAEYRAEVRGLAELEEGFVEDEFDEEEDELDHGDELEEVVEEPELASEELTLSPDRTRTALGAAAMAGRSPRPRRTALPPTTRRSRDTSPIARRSRDTSPYTPVTGISEDSFGHSAGPPSGASTMGRTARRSSSHSVTHRRSMSFLFGGGLGMTGLSMTAASGPNAPGPNSTAIGTGSSGEYTAGSVSGRRSRAPSSSAGGGEMGSLRPLIRRLSTANLTELHATDDEPLITNSPSDGPITLNVKGRRGSRRGSRGSSRRSVSGEAAATTAS
ncbi:hypothetical protein VHUM_01314 [Vanrija humicola]|uniref:Mitogen-activated protein kinase n=1 Tax=Vanrija humicola TaxID=5417 RepID=A0A7D8Z5J0_VANHU|nr:hypothetical protein VHUM_01314 [Vanrija humicola]